MKAFNSEATGQFLTMMPSVKLARIDYINAQKELRDKLSSPNKLQEEMCKYSKDCETGSRCAIIVDNDAATCRSMMMLLKNLGYEIDITMTFDEAKSMIDNKLYEVAVVGVNLNSKETGLDLSKLIPRCTRFYLITDHNEEEVAAITKRCNADGYLMKPWKASDVIRLIGRPSRDSNKRTGC